MQSYLIDNPGVLGFDDDIFKSDETQIIDDELPVIDGQSSKSTNGRIDLLAADFSNGYLGVIELKKDELNEVHLRQLTDYLKKSAEILEKCNLSEEYRDTSLNWVGILVGASIDQKLANKISEGIEAYGIPIGALVLQRFKSGNGSIYITTDVFFKDKRSSNDRTKYRFYGKLLGKGRLVLEVVKRYLLDNPEITEHELRQVFPDKIQGTAIFVPKQEAEEIIEKSKTRIKRHFVKPAELIWIKKAPFAVSNQWGSGKNPNMPSFLELAKKLYPQEIKEDKNA